MKLGKKSKIPYKEVTVSLADSQIRQEAGSGPAKTVVSHALWKKYVQRARALKEDVSDYDRYLKNFGKKRPKLKVMLSDGHPVDCYGPFKCRLNIGPTPVRMTVWVTADPHFGVDFVLGRYDWPVMALKTMHQPPADRPPHNEAHIQCQGPDNREIRTLVDTGAGPNVLCHTMSSRGWATETRTCNPVSSSCQWRTAQTSRQRDIFPTLS